MVTRTYTPPLAGGCGIEGKELGRLQGSSRGFGNTPSCWSLLLVPLSAMTGSDLSVAFARNMAVKEDGGPPVPTIRRCGLVPLLLSPGPRPSPDTLTFGARETDRLMNEELIG